MMNQEILLGSKTHFESRNRRSTDFSNLAQMGKDAIDAGREAANRCDTMVRCLRIVNAIHAHSEFKTESALASLHLPDRVMIDPYNGKPLTIRSMSAGWQVYSVGRDETDSGGSLSDLKDIGIGPPP